MTRKERFAAAALTGLLAARCNLKIQEEVGFSWRYGELMEAAAKRRQPSEHIEIQALTTLSLALMFGLQEARGVLSNRERRIVTEVIGAYGRAVSSDEDERFDRCELTHRFGMVTIFTFHRLPVAS